MSEICYPTSAVARITEASVRQIGYWARTGLLRPSGQDVSGRGQRRRWTFQDIVAAKAISALRKQGCPLQKIRVAVRHLKRHYPEITSASTLSRLTLLTDGRRVYMLTDARDIIDLVTRQQVWAVAVGKLILETRDEVRFLPAEWSEEVKVAGGTYTLQIIRDVETASFTVQCVELPAAISEGRTVNEAIRNGKAAIRDVLSFLARRRRTTGTRRAQTG